MDKETQTLIDNLQKEVEEIRDNMPNLKTNDEIYQNAKSIVEKMDTQYCIIQNNQ